MAPSVMTAFMVFMVVTVVTVAPVSISIVSVAISAYYNGCFYNGCFYYNWFFIITIPPISVVITMVFTVVLAVFPPICGAYCSSCY
jgi:hypothetical protein